MHQDIIKQGNLLVFGAVICFEDNNGGSGHVGIVEEINSQTGEITVSNSAYQSTYFFLTYITPDSNGKYNWSHYTFQGFIYCYEEPTPPIPPTLLKRKKFPWVLYARKLREKRI